jgi:hypothetical protein
MVKTSVFRIKRGERSRRSDQDRLIIRKPPLLLHYTLDGYEASKHAGFIGT